jgi:hypothetical protein
MSLRSELAFQYDDRSFVVSATCTRCGQKMPTPSSNVTFTRDRVLWFAQRFTEHKKLRHRSENLLEFPKPKAS